MAPGGLWEGPLRTLASARGPPRAPIAAQELQCIPDPEFLEAQYHENQAAAAQPQPPSELPSGEVQLVLDPELL